MKEKTLLGFVRLIFLPENLGTYKHQLSLSKKEKTLIKLPNLFAQLDNSSMPPARSDGRPTAGQYYQATPPALLWRETQPGNLVGGAPILFVQRWLNQCGAKAIWARAQFDGARALQGGQERAWGQKRAAIKHATTGRPKRTLVGWTLCLESICIRTNHGSSLGTSLSFA